MNSSRSGLIRLIAVFKQLKAACLVVVGFGVLKLIHTNAATQLEHWVRDSQFEDYWEARAPPDYTSMQHAGSRPISWYAKNRLDEGVPEIAVQHECVRGIFKGCSQIRMRTRLRYIQ